jgi:hypothetical protein
MASNRRSTGSPSIHNHRRTAARRQSGSRITAEAPASVEHADDVDPDGEVWPRPG